MKYDIVTLWFCHTVIFCHCHYVTESHCYTYTIILWWWHLWAYDTGPKLRFHISKICHWDTIPIPHNHSKIIQHPYSVIQSNNETMHYSVRVSHSHKIILTHFHWVTISQLLKLPSVTLSNIRITILSQCATVAQLHSHTKNIRLSVCPNLTLCNSQTITLWHCKIITLSYCNTITLWNYHTVTLSCCIIITLSYLNTVLLFYSHYVKM